MNTRPPDTDSTRDHPSGHSRPPRPPSLLRVMDDWRAARADWRAALKAWSSGNPPKPTSRATVTFLSGLILLGMQFLEALASLAAMLMLVVLLLGLAHARTGNGGPDAPPKATATPASGAPTCPPPGCTCTCLCTEAKR